MAETPQLTIRFSSEMLAQIESEGERLQKDKAAIVRKAVEFYFTYDRQKQKMETVLQEFDALKYEVVKTQAIVLRAHDMDGKQFTSELLAECKKDAEAYLEERRKAC